MKLSNSMTSQVKVCIVEIEQTLQLEVTCFQVLIGERTNIIPMSYHLIAFELTNQLLYMNFPSPERKIFQKNLKSTSSVVLCS